MRRTEQLQGLRLMKFEDVYGRCYGGDLSQVEASEILGVSERTFRRWRDRYEAEGAEGLYDRRLGRVSARRAAVDTVARVLELFETRYRDFTAKHFHEKLVAEHGFGLPNWRMHSRSAVRRINSARVGFKRCEPRMKNSQASAIDSPPSYSPPALSAAQRTHVSRLSCPEESGQGSAMGRQR